MRRFFITFFCFLPLMLTAQSNTYLADLSALKSILQKTASYKTQIKENKLTEYTALYERLAADTVTDINSFRYFYNLAQLLFPIRDNHLAFYQLPAYHHFKTKESTDSFVASPDFLRYPSYNINLDSLKTELSKKPAESVEGIYHYEKFYSVGVFKTSDQAYIGVILHTDTNLWAKGQIALYLYEFAPNIYKAIYGHPAYKYFLFQPVEKYQHQSLVNSRFYGSYSQSVYTKQVSAADYINLPVNTSKFSFRNINDEVKYLLIRTFQANNVTVQASQKFYDSINKLVTAPSLILDLRNNEGGAEKEMKKYLRLLKDYVKKGKLYVLINNGTLSQAEIFTLELRRLKNVTLVGQTTKGMLSYGSNYGKRERLPSGKFELYLTDIINDPDFLQYEDYGIKPDIVLPGSRDWMEQVLEIIRSK